MKVLKVSAPLALLGIAIAYMLVNIAYYAVVPVDVIAASKRILVADFSIMHLVLKPVKLLPFSLLYLLGVMLCQLFSHKVESSPNLVVLVSFHFLVSLEVVNLSTPHSPVLLEHWIIGVIFICAVPPGDSYNFILNLVSYPLNVINTLLGAGLVWIYIRKYQGKYEWNPKIKATFPVAVFFFLSSLYLVAALLYSSIRRSIRL